MNPLDWLISLLPHPRRRRRNSTVSSTVPVAATHQPQQNQRQPRIARSDPARGEVLKPDQAQPLARKRPSTSPPVPAFLEPAFESEQAGQPAAQPASRAAWPRVVMAGLVVVSMVLVGSMLYAVSRPAPSASLVLPSATAVATQVKILPIGIDLTITPTAFKPATRPPEQPIATPTADITKALPTPRTLQDTYSVQPNDSLNIIASKYNVDVQDLVEANKITNPDHLEVGQSLVIPVVTPRAPGPGFKIIPDSELILSPHTVGLSVQHLVDQFGGYLSRYSEKVDDRQTSGADILERISIEYSVNPRILMAVLDYQSGWVTQSSTPDNRRDYPMGHLNAARKGLYRQLAWAANLLNQGYYQWKSSDLSRFTLTDGTSVAVYNGINPGTVGIQNLMSKLYGRSGWEKAVSVNGVYAAYAHLFGYPFDYAYEPLVPKDLTQPNFRLPIEDGTVWNFTGGPHGCWGDGSAWGALDFAPPGEGAGCAPHAAWVTAVADGLVVRSENGVVVLDLDGDGSEQTGWTILYLHIATNGRVKLGAQLKAGDRIGHPSCEGGLSNGTHVHIARRYNGEWIAAEGSQPFVMDGWAAESAGVEYYGYMRRNDQVVEAWDRMVPANQIFR